MSSDYFKICLKCGSSFSKYITGKLCLECKIKKVNEQKELYNERISEGNINKEHGKQLKKIALLNEMQTKNIEQIKHYENKDEILGIKWNLFKKPRPEIGLTLTKEFLIEEYTNNKKSLDDIAMVVGCTRQYVYKKILFYGIPLRDKASARTLAYDGKKISWERNDDNGEIRIVTPQKIRYKKNFFTNWSQEMAWVLGVIYTDGNLHKMSGKSGGDYLGRLSLSQKEPELLNKVLALMESNAKLYFSKRREFANKKDNKLKKIVSGEVYFFHITGNELYNDLINIGLTPDKSLTMKFPVIPQQYVRHFIRGCWDGDGSVYILKRSGRVRASYTCGSLPFISKLVEELIKIGITNGKIHSLTRKNLTYDFKIGGVENIKIFFHYLYDDVPVNQYLQRKYDIFKRCED